MDSPEPQFDMLSKRAKREYRGNSCHRCHHQKIKCSRGKCRPHHVFTVISDKRAIERPCRSCTLANRPCTYAVRDRQVTVSEGYLKSLEGAVAESRNIDPGHATQDGVGRDADMTTLARRPLDPLVENSTVELFLSKLKQTPKLKLSPKTLVAQTESTASCDVDVKRESAKSQIYEYFALNYDTSRKLFIPLLASPY